jgi:hypothetical protein
MFSCRDAMQMLTDERDGALSGSRGAWYRFHMFICPYCKECRRQLARSIALTKDLPKEAVPREVEDAAMAAFRARKGGP